MQEPVFRSVSGSTSDPGVFETTFAGREVSAYKVLTVPANKILVIEYVSALVTRGPVGYPSDNLNDLGAIGYRLNKAENFHFIPFARSEPGGILFASQSIRLYVPAKANVFVKVPLITGQSGGADIDVSGYFLTTP